MKSIHKRGSLLLVAALLLGLFPGLMPTAWAATDITDKFTDPNFRAAVYETIGKTAPEPIYDTDVAGVGELLIEYEKIESLAGVEYFTNMTGLWCGGNPLMSLPELPSSLKSLACYDNQLTMLPVLPPHLEALNCDNNLLTELPELPTSLTWLTCGDNLLTEFPALPDGLTTLACSNNFFTTLPELPTGLTELACGDNLLMTLPKLPPSLKNLSCYRNQLAVLPELPLGLSELFCYGNLLTNLDVSGLSLKRLFCIDNDMIDPSAVKNFTTWCGPRYQFYPQRNAVRPPPLTGLSAWAEEEVTSLDARGVIIPLALRNSFQASIRRDEFTALLVNIYECWQGMSDANSSNYTDIEDSPYGIAIVIAYNRGLVDGTSATTFSPDGLLTREQAAKLLYTMVEKIEGAELGNGTPNFTDNDKISGWAKPYVAYAQTHDLMQGSGGQFDPQGHLTREQAMLVAERLIARYGW